MVIAEFTFKKPVLFFEPDYFYSGISICMTEHVGGMYLMAFNKVPIGLGEFGHYEDKECVKFILSRTSPDNIRTIRVRNLEYGYASLWLKDELTTQPIRTPAIDESIRFVREQATKEKKDAPVRNKLS